MWCFLGSSAWLLCIVGFYIVTVAACARRGVTWNPYTAAGTESPKTDFNVKSVGVSLLQTTNKQGASSSYISTTPDPTLTSFPPLQTTTNRPFSKNSSSSQTNAEMSFVRTHLSIRSIEPPQRIYEYANANRQRLRHKSKRSATLSYPKTSEVMTTTTQSPFAGNRYCQRTQKKYKTKCAPCRSPPRGYPLSSEKIGRCADGQPNRQYRSNCLWQREVETVFNVCCQGYAGSHCDPCPGGSLSPCNNNGRCNKTAGTCTCSPQFSGEACERCKLGMYGPSCNKPCQCVHGTCNDGIEGDGTCVCEGGFKGKKCHEAIPLCLYMDCEKKINMKCGEVDGRASCVCNEGYRMNEHEKCLSIIYPCDDDPSRCPKNSKCVHLTAGKYKCNCARGFQLDGVGCVPSDPCARNYGTCSEFQKCDSGRNARKNIPEADWLKLVEQYHTYLNAGGAMNATMQRQLRNALCSCKSGFREIPGGDGCAIIDACARENPCSPNADCHTVSPRRTECKCKTGFKGDGRMCRASVILSIAQLKSEFKLNLAFEWFNTHFYEPFTTGGQFTIFLPDDEAFNIAFNGSKQAIFEFLNDTDRSSPAMMQHILMGRFALTGTENYVTLCTLYGNFISITLQRSALTVYEYQLQPIVSPYHAPVAKATKRNIEAYNGIIHIVDKLLMIEPKVEGNRDKNARQLIQDVPTYNKFENLIEAASMHVQDAFSRPQITVLVPESRTHGLLSQKEIDYFKNTEMGKGKLDVILLNHIIPGKYSAFGLIEKWKVSTLAHINVSISTDAHGRTMLNNRPRIKQADIPFNNGFIHTVTDLVIPHHLHPLLPRTCRDGSQGRAVVTETCGPCPVKDECTNATEYSFVRMQTCSYMVLDVMQDGCQVVCVHTPDTDRCCPGFFGPNCWPCPGLDGEPCNGAGKCDDLDVGTGTCACDEGFSGYACEKCEDDNMYGPNCTTTCKCLHGVCDNGPSGTGLCKPGTCHSEYFGIFCDRHESKCQEPFDDQTLECPANSECFKLDDEDAFRCECKSGYQMDGESCVLIDPCNFEDHGRCHLQATCERTSLQGILSVKCTCNEGWEGDGFFCAPISVCEKNTTLCGPGLTCYDLEPGHYACMKYDPCDINNGGCHRLASCVATSERTASCSCPTGYGGDGRLCFGTIDMEVASHPNLTKLSKMLDSLPSVENILHHKADPMTFLAPSDNAINRFLEKAGPNMNHFWNDSDFIINSIAFHTLLESYKYHDFMYDSNTATFKKYQTFYDGFSIHIGDIGNSLHIFMNQSDTAQFLVVDIPAINGYIHIIDGVLEPFLPDATPPDLKDAMVARKQRLSRFEEACRTYKFFEAVDAYNEFTVFAPINNAIANTVWNEDYLATYRIPIIILTPSIMNGDTDYDHLNLKFTVDGGRLYVNNVLIVESNILVEGGVMHVIDGLLHLPQNRCDRPGSQQCCPGFFGPECQKCPECGDRSGCHDGIRGDGNCHCWPRFKPPQCRECLDLNMTGPLCEIPVKHCHLDRDTNCAESSNNCIVTPSGEKCRCPIGRVSADNECVDPCKKQLGFHCHPLATCLLQDDHNYSCHCAEGFDGDGVNECILDINRCKVNNGECDTEDRSQCTFTPILPNNNRAGSENVSCTCVPGYVGDGHLCSTSLLDALSRIPQLSYVTEYLSKEENSPSIDLLQNFDTSATLFLPIDKDWSRLNMEGLTVLGEPIVLDRNQLQTADDNITNRWTVAGMDDEVITIELRKDNQFYVNDVLVVRKNIPALNGILHLTSSPIASTTMVIGLPSTQLSSSSSNTTVIAAGVSGALVLIAVIVVAVVVVHRRERSQSHDVASDHLMQPLESDGSVSLARLETSDSVDESSTAQSDCSFVGYTNPAFEDEVGDDTNLLSS